MTSTSKAEHQAVRVDELDGLRGLLSVWVALAHMFCWSGFWESVSGPGLLKDIWEEFVGAGSAVDAFIILSGFAISFLLSRRQESYGRFMRGRFFRIYPVYLVCLVLGTVAALWLTPFVLSTAAWRNATVYFEWNRDLSLSETSATGLHAFWHLTLLNGVLPKSVLSNSTGTLLGPAWSITLEWQYYLVAPLLARVIRSGTGTLFLVALSWVGSRLFGPGNPQYAFLLHQLPLFLVGIGSFHLYEMFAASRHERSRAFAIPVAAVLALGFLTRWHAVALTLWALAFGCIFVQGDDLFSRFLAMVRSALRHRWLQWLGHISYPLYLVHWPMIIGFLAMILRWNPNVSSRDTLLLLIFVGFPLILLVAVALHVGIERPMMNLGRRLDRGK
ncbi:acyltransferase family protein [Prosthecobacter sp.]|uniref:acyltransferase family protein n=1 Tax=Prosthecobacter sp. TaxID=1965333 RepID=UPI003782F26C